MIFVLTSVRQVQDGIPVTGGDYVVDGVAGTGAEIAIDFDLPGEGATSAVFPTGNRKDELNIPGFGPITTTIVNSGNCTVFVKAEDVGLDGCEQPAVMKSKPEMMKLLEDIR